ncbi:MAG: hypothetical protein BAJALOKI3v1_720001 [Promethearchaeota archaeon]|jgi:uncharacterized protein Yka (UPF0111/DUF47 family)|nr:MAG: hypothetical protein BAJALOKI3v1_720001 [Candidatus Lokiarchaeota archaeon]
MASTIDEITSLLIEHSRILYQVVSDMGVYYTDWQEGKKASKKDLKKRMSKLQLLEEDADNIKIRLIKEFSEASAQGLGDYMTLILRMDNVINAALEFVDILSKIDAIEEFNEDMKSSYHKMINTILEMTNVLKLAIKNLRDNPQEVFQNTTNIHELENDIDLVFREFLDYLYNNKEIDIRLLLRIRDSIKILEELADRIHDIGDLLRVLRYS